MSSRARRRRQRVARQLSRAHRPGPSIAAASGAGSTTAHGALSAAVAIIEVSANGAILIAKQWATVWWVEEPPLYHPQRRRTLRPAWQHYVTEAEAEAQAERINESQKSQNRRNPKAFTVNVLSKRKKRWLEGDALDAVIVAARRRREAVLVAEEYLVSGEVPAAPRRPLPVSHTFPVTSRWSRPVGVVSVGLLAVTAAPVHPVMCLGAASLTATATALFNAIELRDQLIAQHRAAGRTMQEIAKLVGVVPSTVHKVLHEQEPPPAPLSWAFAVVFWVPPHLTVDFVYADSRADAEDKQATIPYRSIIVRGGPTLVTEIQRRAALHAALDALAGRAPDPRSPDPRSSRHTHADQRDAEIEIVRLRALAEKQRSHQPRAPGKVGYDPPVVEVDCSGCIGRLKATLAQLYGPEPASVDLGSNGHNGANANGDATAELQPVHA